MIEQVTTDFITGYTADTRDRIAFAWNQKHGAEFKDSNFQFRQQVIKGVIAAPEQTSIELLHDLFEAEARWSKEAWCICDGFGKIGALMLKRRGIDSLDHFLKWFSNSFDSFSECHTMQLDSSTVDAMLNEVNRRLAAADKDADKGRLEIAKMLFDKFKKGNPTQGMFKVDANAKFENIEVVSSTPTRGMAVVSVDTKFENRRVGSKKFEIWLRKLKSLLISRK
jgi:hypothetical protein